MNVLLLGGGKSGEHEVSLVSAAAIARNIDRTKHRVLLAGITKAGRWFLQDDAEYARLLGDPQAALAIAETAEIAAVPGGGFYAGGKRLSVDLVFPALHGTFGEDGTVQGLLEMAGVPYTGCGVLSSAVAMNKEQTKIIWQQAGLPVVPWMRVYAGDSVSSRAAQAECALGYPLFVKPCCSGSSVGAAKAKDRAALEAALGEAFKWDDKALIEKAVDAREIETAVTGDSTRAESVVVYGAGEIIPHHEFYDYDAKYIDPDGAALVIPAPISAAEYAAITGAAAKAYCALGCAGLARVDFFLERGTNSVFLNEINTMPGFTPISMFPKLCAEAGLAFPALIELLLEDGENRFRARAARV
jgi:D-alanine-D-alanine ligase